jgi:hypothetical protein
MRNPIRSITNTLAGAIALVAVLLAFVFGGGSFNLPIFFFMMAFVVIVSSLGSLRPRAIYGGIQGAIWMIMLSLFFLTGSWLWFLVGAIITVILSALMKPILAALLGMGFLAAMQASQQPQQPQPYQPQQPYQQPYQEPYQQYQQGYQPPQQPTYQEGGQQYQYPGQSGQPKEEMQYEQPQAQYPQYPQQMPPQQ